MVGHPHQNRLLAQLDTDDRVRVLAACTPIRFTLGDTLLPAESSITHLVFVEEGILSVITEIRDGRSVEAGMVGFEGVAGVQAAFVPSRTRSRYECQGDGHGLRIEAARLRSLVDDSEGLRRALSHYQARVQHELEQANACNVLHNAERRLAKWLLRCHDRMDGDVLRLTQEYLAAMLGAQRTTVNEAAQHLQAQGAIRYMRGKLTIIDRPRLERAACECYTPLHRAEGQVLREREVDLIRVNGAATSTRGPSPA